MESKDLQKKTVFSKRQDGDGSIKVFHNVGRGVCWMQDDRSSRFNQYWPSSRLLTPSTIDKMKGRGKVSARRL